MIYIAISTVFFVGFLLGVSVGQKKGLREMRQWHNSYIANLMQGLTDSERKVFIVRYVSPGTELPNNILPFMRTNKTPPKGP